MAKMDTSIIPGYSEMSAEDKVKALESYTFPDADFTGYVKKETFDKTASEAAEWKRKHNALLSDEEKKKAQADEDFKKMQDELASLKKEKTVSQYTAKFVALGYDEKLATETANAFADGDMETVFANQKTFITTHDKTLKADAMKNTATPPAGTGSVGTDYNRLIAEANARGDYAGVAALIRQQQQDN